ncbi:hypothetical protein ACFQ05_05750 [Amycolatopsis umgeniensis]|uniref:Lipoprotein n=1 Tax=Amycolatopsis umgeniensis TaxID=336628 RepID=A0A841B1S6_9PSEU|nr:hypothetical protein [Amycolatopsis umgeniensis]MBB5852780.1 hypothetical protein [Amycolatopsis umgeniensis]
MRRGIVSVLLLVSACSTATPPPSSPETVLLRAKTYVGMPSPKPALVPEFSLYGGGRLLVPGETVGSLQTVSEKRLDSRAVEEVYSAAHSADLDRDAFLPNSNVLDGYLLVFTLYDKEGKRRQVRAENPSGELDDFQEDLAEVAKKAESVPTPYRPTRMAAVGWASSTRPNSEARPWPFASFDRTPHVDGGLCVVLEGESVRQAEELARSATPATRWRTAETTWLVVFRPLLPDERSCDDLMVPHEPQ